MCLFSNYSSTLMYWGFRPEVQPGTYLPPPPYSPFLLGPISWHQKDWFWGLVLFGFCPFRASPKAYAGSQARGLIRVVAAGPHQSHSNVRSELCLGPAAHGNARSLTHWARPGMEPTTSWFLVGFVSATPRGELFFFFSVLCILSSSSPRWFIWPLFWGQNGRWKLENQEGETQGNVFFFSFYFF